MKREINIVSGFFVKLFLCFVIIMGLTSITKAESIQPYATPINVGNFADFKSALTSGNSDIDINITDEFSLSESISIAPTTKNITIDSDDDVTLTKTSALDYIFMIRSEANITFNNKITLDNNNSNGMFNIYGSLSGDKVELNNLLLKNSTKVAIYHTNINLGLSINDSKFDNNKSTGSGGTINFNGPQLSVKNSTFTNGYAKFGGAISIEANSKLLFENSVINGSEAMINGGAINAKTNTQIDILSGEISGNTAINGGAIHAESGLNGGVITLGDGVSKPILNDNVADEGAKLNGLYNGFGGAIFSKELIINNAQINNNEATKNGGAIYTSILTIHDGEVSYNKASKGGGIFAGAILSNSNVSVIINNGTISHNVASATAANELGGGGLTVGDPTDSSMTNLRINGGTIDNNTAYVNGGGISITAHTSTIIKNATISDNKVIGVTSGLQNSAAGGGIYIRGDLRELNTTIGEDTIISNNSANGNGGGIFFERGTLTIKDNATLKDNSSISKNGGAVFTSQLLFENGNIVENKASLDGGAVYINDINALSEFQQGTIKNNTAVNGGAIYSKSPLTIDGDIKFLENKASEFGGAIYSTDNLLINNNASFDMNHAANHGGALYLNFEDEKSANIINASFDNNESLKDGGAIYTTSINNSDPLLGLKSLFVQEDSSFSNNKAQKFYNWFVDESATDPESVSKIYMNNIFTTHSTEPFANIYNNFDTGFGLTPLVVTFDFNSPSTSMENVYVHVYKNDKVNPLSVNNFELYSFLGWREDKNSMLSHNDSKDALVFFDFNTPIVEDKTLYGQWIEIVKASDEEEVNNKDNDKDNNKDNDDNNIDNDKKDKEKDGKKGDDIDGDTNLPITGATGLFYISIIVLIGFVLTSYVIVKRRK